MMKYISSKQNLKVRVTATFFTLFSHSPLSPSISQTIMNLLKHKSAHIQFEYEQMHVTSLFLC